jgi:hypothetical protein
VIVVFDHAEVPPKLRKIADEIVVITGDMNEEKNQKAFMDAVERALPNGSDHA